MPRLFLILLASLTLAACGSVRPVSTDDPDPELVPPPRTETPAYPAYETFDPAPYDVEPAEQPRGVEHDVPAVLMEGTIEIEEQAGPRTVEGFRIQVFSSAEKAAAERVRDEVGAWWRIARQDPAAADVLPEELPVVVEFVRPYYRVRLGAFEFRPQAETALELVRSRFPEAFVVPSTVEVE